MRKLGFILILISLVANTRLGAQANIDRLMKIKPTQIGTHPYANDSDILYMPMDFSSSEFVKNYANYKFPKDRFVITIHLVYTKYREVDTFDQPLLNRNRFENLKTIWPELFATKGIQFKVFEQNSAKTEDAAKKLYHGFIIFFKAKVSEKVKEEKGIIGYTISTYRDSMIWIPEKVIYKKRKRYVETGYYLANDPEKRKEGFKYKTPSIWFREKEIKLVVDSVVARKIKAKKVKVGRFDKRFLQNTNEYDAFVNKIWKGKWGIVTDVTGSMGPYSAQVLLFLKYNSEVLKNSRFTFFNDGNGAPELIKRIGFSGGVYNVNSNNFDTIYRTILMAMENGNGGDIPENNIEAIISATKKWNDIDTILMIADAGAPIKDIVLLKQLKKPVSIILCGNVDGNVPFDYFMLARETGGTIIQTNDEIRNLRKYKKGDVVEVGERTYRLSEFGLLRTDE